MLHTIGGKPILGHVIECAMHLNPEKIIVVHGYEGDKVKSAFQQLPIIWAEQKQQLGTGHAVQQALPYIDTASTTLILLGDVPLVSMDACQRLIEKAKQQLVIQSFIKKNPTGYGRIVRDPKACLLLL